MMMITSELSAAPHLPPPLRALSQPNTLANFMWVLSNAGQIEIVEENGELHLVCHPLTAD